MIAALLLKLGLSGKASKWFSSLLMVLAVPLLCALAYRAGSGAGHAECEQQGQAQKLAAANAAAADLLEMRAENSRLSAKLAAARSSGAATYRVIREAVPRVVKEYVHEDRAVCSFDHHFIRLWNDATFGSSAGVPEATGHSAGSSSGTGAVEGPAEAGVGDVLGNHIDNSEGCWQTRQQLNALIQWHREHP